MNDMSQNLLDVVRLDGETHFEPRQPPVFTLFGDVSKSKHFELLSSLEKSDVLRTRIDENVMFC